MQQPNFNCDHFANFVILAELSATSHSPTRLHPHPHIRLLAAYEIRLSLGVSYRFGGYLLAQKLHELFPEVLGNWIFGLIVQLFGLNQLCLYFGQRAWIEE